MDALLIVVVTFAGYLVAYHTYGRFLARKIFRLDDSATVPSVRLADGVDYVPTRRGIIFGHHYASIAGTGPIVGPAIGIIWGWVPALIWVFVGSIVMGAVHDFGALVVSMRNDGKSLSEVAARYLGTRARTVFFLVVFLELVIVIAIFAVVIASIFNTYPTAVFPIWIEIPIAVALGAAVYRWKANVLLATAVAVLAMYGTVVLGRYLPFEMKDVTVGGWVLPATGVWVLILLVYAYVASTLPVTALLQPRDYINAWQLFIAMGLLFLGVVGSAFFGGLEIVAPAYNAAPKGAPPIWPFLGVTIACGAISGFHCLVSGGTTSKQVRRESDSLFVGYGSMLMEGALAILVLVAVAAGIGMAYESATGETLTGTAAWNSHYASWEGVTSGGIGGKVAAVVIGAANMLETIGIPKVIGVIIMGVFIASFAGTTLDTATRIQRYVISELAAGFRVKALSNRWVATLIAVGTAGGLAFATGADGEGALTLWPMFGAVNQLLAALALLLITIYLRRRGTWGYLLTLFPCLFMLVLTVWAMVVNEINFVSAGNWLLVGVNGVTLLVALALALEAFVNLARPRKCELNL
ncbi:MAG: carbon starvation protein A [Phycisphaerae bacterium]